LTLSRSSAYYFLTFGVFIILKFTYTLADTNHLKFLLSPINRILKLITGAHSRFIIDRGFYFDQFNVIIDKSCSGFNFLLICFLMLSFVSLKYFEKRGNKVLAMIFSLLGAYVLTILVNSSRIFSLIIIHNQSIALAGNPIVHESIGILTNLTFLILTYLVVNYLLTKHKSNEKFA